MYCVGSLPTQRSTIVASPLKIKTVSKPAVVLDLDETLIFASPIKHDADCFSVKVDRRRMYIRFRPGLQEFLSNLGAHYQIFFFTAAKPEYANPIIDKIAPGTSKNNRLFRDDCTNTDGYSVKDLRMLNIPLTRVLLVDDMSGSALFQPSNLIRITPWHGDVDDVVLLTELLPALNSLHSESDLPAAFSQLARRSSYSYLYSQ